MCSPHWRVGFLFLVLYPRLLLPVLLLPVLLHSLTHSLARSLTHSLMHSLTHSLIDTHSLTGTHSSLTHWHTLITHSLTRSLTHSRPGVPWSPPLCRWLLRGRRGTWCSARGRMYALASLGLRWLLRGRRGTWCSARGRMYALASLGLRCSAGGFCVAGAALGALQGVGCTPRPLVSGGFCVAGAALGALQGVGCTPWRPLVSAALPVAFAWQARHLVLCKASDVRPGGLRWLLRGRRGT